MDFEPARDLALEMVEKGQKFQQTSCQM